MPPSRIRWAGGPLGILAVSVLILAADLALHHWITRRPETKRRSTKVIVIGVDGMDPRFVEAHWNSLPHLDELRKHGSFARLATTDPPQSPVAWATFATGLPPSQHGIFDFVLRDPKTFMPFSSFGRTVSPRAFLPLGPFRFPLQHGRIISLRHGTTFWQLLAKNGVPVMIVKIPDNYPPIAAGRELAGMGTPDLRGSLGTFTFYTDDPNETSRPVDGGQIETVALRNGRARLSLTGPSNTLRKDQRLETAQLIADVDPERPLLRITLGEQQIILKQGEWSDWLQADFPLVPYLPSVHGTVRIFAKQLHPRFELYVSPVNVDPLDPALPVSYPSSWSKTVAHEIGRYSTLGIPEDTSALRNGVLDLNEFRSQSHLVLDEEEKLLRYSLRHFESGLLFYYFSSVDQNSHVLWGKHEQALLTVYQAIDASIGEVMKSEPSAEWIVMSDHGFTSFNRAVHLNTWLFENGFLALNAPPSEDASLKDIDWSKTKAYALGLNALYLNLAGREEHGIVHSGPEARAVAADIRAQLLNFRDPITGRAVVEKIELVHPALQNARLAPDLIVGYAPGYRASWQTALGGVPGAVISDNTDAWIGDHCIDPDEVPGVLFTSRKLRLAAPGLQDLAVTILDLFGVKPPPAMRGHSLY